MRITIKCASHWWDLNPNLEKSSGGLSTNNNKKRISRKPACFAFGNIIFVMLVKINQRPWRHFSRKWRLPLICRGKRKKAHR